MKSGILSVFSHQAPFALILCIILLQSAGADDWPQWRGPGRDGVWKETGILEKFDGAEISLRWSVPISGGYSGPTVADGRVYVSDRVDRPVELERIHCFEWQTGKKIWSHQYECPYGGMTYRAGPRASVLVDGGRAYSLGTMGHLRCLDARTGREIWSKDIHALYGIRMPRWGIAASPVIEGDLIILQVGCRGDACLLAFDKKTGQERWKALPDEATYSAPIIIEQEGRRELICRTADRIVGMNPATGRLNWEFPYPYEKRPIAIATPVLHENTLVFSDAHQGTLLLRLRGGSRGVEKVWHSRGDPGTKGNRALHCLQSTPLVKGGHIYGVGSYGILRCLDLQTGRQVWQTEKMAPRDRWATAHLVQNGDRVWIFNELGELIIANLSPGGYGEISRARLIEPTKLQLLRRRNGVTWSHPAFAYRHVFARNDLRLVCASLEKQEEE